MEIFNLGLQEIIVIALIALVVLGPERLPEMMRRLGRLTAQARRVSAEFQRILEEELEPLDEVRRDVSESVAPVREASNELRSFAREVPRLTAPSQIIARGGTTEGAVLPPADAPTDESVDPAAVPAPATEEPAP